MDFYTVLQSRYNPGTGRSAVRLLPELYSAVRKSLPVLDQHSCIGLGSALGGVVWPILLNHFFNRTQLGFAWSVRIVAFIILAMLIVANLIVSPGTAPAPASGNQPSLWVRLQRMSKDGTYVLFIVA